MVYKELVSKDWFISFTRNWSEGFFREVHKDVYFMKS